MQGTWVLFLGGEHPLGKETATYSSILVWRNPWTEEPGGLQPTGLQRVSHDWATWQQQQQGAGIHTLQLRKKIPLPQLRPSVAQINTFYIKKSITSFFKKRRMLCACLLWAPHFRICRILPWIPQWAGRCCSKREAWRPGFKWDVVQEKKELKGENEGNSVLFFWHVFVDDGVLTLLWTSEERQWNLKRESRKNLQKIRSAVVLDVKPWVFSSLHTMCGFFVVFLLLKWCGRIQRALTLERIFQKIFIMFWPKLF